MAIQKTPGNTRYGFENVSPDGRANQESGQFAMDEGFWICSIIHRHFCCFKPILFYLSETPDVVELVWIDLRLRDGLNPPFRSNIWEWGAMRTKLTGIRINTPKLFLLLGVLNLATLYLLSNNISPLRRWTFSSNFHILLLSITKTSCLSINPNYILWIWLQIKSAQILPQSSRPNWSYN